MPWFPEFASAMELARQQTRAAGQADPGSRRDLPGIVGRGRAFEILLGGDDFDGELAERYGYVKAS